MESDTENGKSPKITWDNNHYDYTSNILYSAIEYLSSKHTSNILNMKYIIHKTANLAKKKKKSLQGKWLKSWNSPNTSNIHTWNLLYGIINTYTGCTPVSQAPKQ
jgi:hypothetical protein